MFSIWTISHRATSLKQTFMQNKRAVYHRAGLGEPALRAAAFQEHPSFKAELPSFQSKSFHPSKQSFRQPSSACAEHLWVILVPPPTKEASKATLGAAVEQGNVCWGNGEGFSTSVPLSEQQLCPEELEVLDSSASPGDTAPGQPCPPQKGSPALQVGKKSRGKKHSQSIM